MFICINVGVIVFAAACGNSSSLDNQKNAGGNDTTIGSTKPKELTVQFVPSQNAGTLRLKQNH